jgi:hypothetical protein
MKKENRLFVSLYSEDAFHGISIPYELKRIIEHLYNTPNIVDDMFEDYDEYRDYEVELASQARGGSDGTADVDTVEELKSIFSWNKSVIEKINSFENDSRRSR